MSDYESFSKSEFRLRSITSFLVPFAWLFYFFANIGKPARRRQIFFLLLYAILGCLVGACLLSIVTDGIFGQSPTIAIVKNGHLDGYPKATIGDMADSFLGSPKWTSGMAKDGTTFVNLSGKASLQEKTVNIVLQFEVNENSKTFKVNALEINKVPQNAFMIMGLLEAMYDSVTTN